jgi:hypothetical protein
MNEFVVEVLESVPLLDVVFQPSHSLSQFKSQGLETSTNKL